MISYSFEIIAKHPAAILIAGGILLLLLSNLNESFPSWGWTLIILGAILQVMWLVLFRRI